MTSKYFFSLKSFKPQKSTNSGSLTNITVKEVPGFENIAFSSLKLNKKASEEPIWHPNSNKIGYCVSGEGLVSIRTPAAVETFSIAKGDVFFIPKGYIHHITNTGDAACEIAFAFNNQSPDTMHLSKAVQSLSDSVFTTSFNAPSSFLEGLKKSKNSDLIKSLPSVNGSHEFISSRYKFNIESSAKAILTKGGYVQLATKPNLPVLDGLGILGFGLKPKGAVEPHWHTNAGELVYIVKGKTRITVLAPDDTVTVMEVNGGEGCFAPASHFHNIENIGNDDVEVIAFFSHEEPDYIGIGEVVGSYSNEVLCSIFNVDAKYFDTFKKPTGPLVIVPV